MTHIDIPALLELYALGERDLRRPSRGSGHPSNEIHLDYCRLPGSNDLLYKFVTRLLFGYRRESYRDTLMDWRSEFPFVVAIFLVVTAAILLAASNRLNTYFGSQPTNIRESFESDG